MHLLEEFEKKNTQSAALVLLMPSPTSFTRSKEQRRAYSFIPFSFLGGSFLEQITTV